MSLCQSKKNIGFIIVFFVFLFLPLFSGEPKISNLTMVPSNPNFGEEVTISFDLCITSM